MWKSLLLGAINTGQILWHGSWCWSTFLTGIVSRTTASFLSILQPVRRGTWRYLPICRRQIYWIILKIVCLCTVVLVGIYPYAGGKFLEEFWRLVTCASFCLGISVAACRQKLANYGIVVLLYPPHTLQFFVAHTESTKWVSRQGYNRSSFDFKDYIFNGCMWRIWETFQTGV